MCRHSTAITRVLVVLLVQFAGHAWSNCMAAETGVAAELDNPAERWSADGRGGTPSFTKHVVPLFAKVGCSARSCHGSFQGQNGFRLSLFGYDPKLDHDELTLDEGNGPRVNVKSVDESLALRKPLGQVDHDGGDVLAAGSWQHEILRQWIAGGARYEPDKEAYLMRLEVVPSELRLSAETSQSVSLRVVAHFDDGTSEDVTALTNFSSNDEGVATVSGKGVVTAAGTGDAAVVVRYGGGVVTFQVIIPQSSSDPFPDFLPHNKVDELVAEKLKKVGIHPSGLADDAQFLRRAFVDAIGTLPTSDEVREFLADRRPDKRQRAIERLLDRPEYAMYWATMFSDWTGNNPLVLNPNNKVTWLWHDWLRDKLARNVPYDELVGGIVTATSREGRPLDEYLAEVETVYANFQPPGGAKDKYDDGTYARRRTLDLYWMKRGGGPEELSIRTANAFLGVQIQCAQCHKHPFDRWSKEDFESFTSIFRTTSVCDLDGSEKSQGRMDYDKVAVYPGVSQRLSGSVKQHPPKILGGDAVPYDDGDADPRVALWQWMRSADNPYFAQNIANRLWGHYFGVGIVDPVDDFNAANPPSNPPLLDWLARDFREHDFDLKHLHRTVLGSRTYQLSDVPNATNRGDRRNFSHALVKRMPAEVIYDALAQATGTAHEYSTTFVPPRTRAIGLAPPLRFGRASAEYALRIFGRPKREQTCACERSNAPSLAQALFLINDEDVHSRVSSPSGSLAELVKTPIDDRQLVVELYLTTLSRYPRENELQKALAYVAKSDSRDAAMQDVLWSLINVREFIFVR